MEGAARGDLAGFSDLAALPGDARWLLEAAGAEDFQFGPGWFRAVAAAALPAGARPLLLSYREAGQALALLPLQRGAGRLAGLTTPYTSRFRPLAAAGAGDAALRRAGAAFGRFCRRFGPLRLDSLDAEWAGLPPLLAGLRDAGLVPLRFAHFANWHTPLPDDWPAYLAERPGELRETIRRRLAQAGRDPAIRFDFVTGGDGLAVALAAYEAIYAASWKQSEPYPGFTASLLPLAAAAGALRLGVLRDDGRPVAAQYWLVAGGTATLVKLAHDEAARARSPGTVLTALMVRGLIGEGVRALDFGRGDDAYKAGWTGRRRTRIGVLLCPWRHPAGLMALARHGLAPRLVRSLSAARRTPVNAM